LDEEIRKLFKYLDYIYRLDNCLTSYGYVCYYKDYIDIADLIPKDKIVVDVGCGFGLQQILFRNHKHYYGINKFKEGKNCNIGALINLDTITDNTTVMQGMFKDIWQQTGITEENKDQYFGISNRSLWNDPSTNSEDIDIFKKLFPKNNYVTDENGKRIQY
jgi:hypothetical protein